MAINFVPGQVAQGDPNPGGPTAISNIKDLNVKVCKLSSANFSTTNVDTLLAVLPQDSTILRLSIWVKTALAGGGVATPTLALGSASGGAQFHAASALAAGTAGTYTVMPTPLAIVQNYALPFGADIQIWGRGATTVGNPTSGEMYLIIDYVR